MARYKVEFDRNGCIGAAACAAVYPEAWVMQDDGKPDVTGAARDAGNEKQELVIDEKDLPKHLEAARSCPVLVIHITNLDTGEKLI
ncbi:ferredoxin [Candidatus Micrarchaeota archaeon]|nr:ferredoxin [Candidatus Micrarchaeota archaeon]MBI5176819.1 ferredoxin [Candidatus Micrarchaeota archaeon]